MTGRTSRASGARAISRSPSASSREGRAYRCYCTAEELAEERAAAQRENRPFIYSRRCLALSAEERRAREASGAPVGGAPARSRRGRLRRRGSRAGLGALRVRAARRSRDPALGRRPDLQLREPDRRRRHAHHARDPGRGSAQLDAATGARARGARRAGAGLRPPAAALRPRSQAPLEAPRRDERGGTARGRLSGRGGRELPRAARLALRLRARVVHARGADRPLLARARQSGARPSSTPRSSSG